MDDQHTLPFPSDGLDFDSSNDYSHSPSNKANELLNLDADFNAEHNVTNAAPSADFSADLANTQADAITNMFSNNSSDSHHSESQSQSPDHPPPAQFYTSPPAQSSAYSLIDPELRPPTESQPQAPPLIRHDSWQTTLEADFSSSGPDFFEPTRRSSIDSGIGSDGELKQNDGLPVFLTPEVSQQAPLQTQSQLQAEDGQGVPPPKPKKSHARKQPPGHIPRARNAFILFRKHITDSNLIPASVEIKHQNISVVAAKMWREAPPDVRTKFQELARVEKEDHQRKYPGYRYQPVFRRTDIIRRRVRKEAHEDDKVDAVAELLMKGKAGSALEKEIKEQLKDRTGEDSDSGVESSAGSTSSRRRRTDAGQLSKGALRAQKSQSRARALRQSAYDTEMINLQQLNQGYNIGSNGMQHAQDDTYLLDYGALPPTMPQRRSFHGDYGYDDSQTFNPPGMYPPMQLGDNGLDGGYSQLQQQRPWPDQHQYYNGGFPDPTAAYQAQVTDPAYFQQQSYQPPAQYDAVPIAPIFPAGAEYSNLAQQDSDAQRSQGFGIAAQPADIIAGQYLREGANHLLEDDQGEDPRMRWSREQLPTPSNHVSFQDDLFAAEGGLGLDRDLQEYVGAMEQAEQELPSGW